MKQFILAFFTMFIVINPLTSSLVYADETLVVSGTWNTLSNWSGNTLPTSSDNVYIDGSLSILLPVGVSGTGQDIWIGNTGNGTLNVNGGTLSNVTGEIGYNAGSNGTVTVISGAWNNSGNLVVGNYGSGSLNVNGGTVTAGSYGYIGFFAGSSGTATITSGTWQNAGSLNVGFSGTAVLNVNGGTVTNIDGEIGYFADSIATATVTSGSWNNSGVFVVGSWGSGNLNVNGGNVTVSGSSYLGYWANSIGVATVTGGTWNNSQSLVVGNSGTGTLSLSGSGIVSVNGGIGTLTLASLAGSVGTLNMGNLTTGTLSAASIYGGAGTATVNLNQTSGVYVFSPQLTGTLSVNKNGTGTTILTSSNTYTGSTTVNAGTLVVSGSLTSSTNVTVSGAGMLNLAGGAITTGGTVNVSGILSLTGGASSVGQLNMNTGATLQTVISGVSTGAHALVSTNGGVNLLGSVNLSIDSTGYIPTYTLGNLAASDKFILTLGNGTAAVGTFANVISIADSNYSGGNLNEYTDSNGNTWAVFYNVSGTNYLASGTDIVLLAIPEPSTWGMIVFGIGILTCVRRLHPSWQINRRARCFNLNKRVS